MTDIWGIVLGTAFSVCMCAVIYAVICVVLYDPEMTTQRARDRSLAMTFEGTHIAARAETKPSRFLGFINK